MRCAVLGTGQVPVLRDGVRDGFELDMNSRLDLDLSIRATVPSPRNPQATAAPA